MRDTFVYYGLFMAFCSLGARNVVKARRNFSPLMAFLLGITTGPLGLWLITKIPPGMKADPIPRFALTAKTMPKAIWVWMLVGLIAQWIFVLAVIDDHTVTRQERIDAAANECEADLSLQLKSPTSAVFRVVNATDTGDGSFTLIGVVDADNSFGAKIRTDWSCHAEPTDGATSTSFTVTTKLDES